MATHKEISTIKEMVDKIENRMCPLAGGVAELTINLLKGQPTQPKTEVVSLLEGWLTQPKELVC